MAQNQPQHIMDAGGGQTGSPAAHSSPVGPSTPPVMSGSIPVPSRSASAGLSFGTDLGHLLCDSSSGWSASTTSPPNIPRNFIHSQVGHQTLPPQMPVHQQPTLPQNTLFIDEIIPYLPRSLWDNSADRFHLLQSLANLSLDQQQHLLLVLQQQWVENQQQQLQQQTHSSIGLGVDPSLQRPCNVPSTLQNMDAPDIALPSLRSFSVSQDTFQAGLSSSSDLDGIGGPLHRSSSDLGSRIHSFHLDLGNLTNNVRTNVDDENPIQSVFSHHQQLGQLPMPSNFPPSSASFPHNSCSSGTHLGSAVETAPLTSLQSNLDQGKLINLNQELSGLYVEDLQRAPGTPLSQTPPPKVVADPGSICFQNGSLNGDADGRNKSPQNNGAHAGSNSSYAATASKSKKNKKNNKNSTESQIKKTQHVSGNDNPASKGSDVAAASSHDQSVGAAATAATPQQFSFYSTDQNIFLEKMGSLSSSIVNWISRDKVKPRKTSAGDVSDDSATAAHKTDAQNLSNKAMDGQNASGYSSFVPCSFVNPNTRTAHNKSLNSNKLSYSDVLSSSKAASEASSSKASSGFVHAGPRANKFTESPATGNNAPLIQNHIVQNPSKKTKNNSAFSSSPSLTAKSKKASNPFFSSRVGLDEFVHPTVEELASSSRLLDTFNSTPYSTSDKKSTSPNTRSKKSEASAYNTEESEEEAAASTQGLTSSKQKTKSPSTSAATLLNNNNKIFNQKQNLKKSSFINNLCEASASSVSATGTSEQQLDSKQPPQQPASDAAPAAARSEESSSEDDSSQPCASTHTLSSESPPSPSWPSKNSGGAGSVSCVSLKSRSSFNTSNNNNNNVTKGSGGGSRNKGSSKKRKEQNDWSAVAAGVLQLCWRYVLLACKWLYDLVAEVILMSSSLFWHGWTKALSFVRVYGSVGLGGLRDGWGYLVDRLDRLCRPKGSKKRLRDAASATHYLEQNIALPSTGDEAMKRLLACRGLNNYSILGVTPQASQEDIRRYYRRQAFLVHPDKNKTPGAEEAFKVLGHAFEEIGEPAKREAYDKRLLGESQLGEAWDKLADLLKELERKLEESANLICCTSCPNKHKRIKVPDRPLYAARYCEQCNIRHGAKEGDIWAESRYYGLRWRYYACMEGAVYDITEWASCQAGNLKQLRANTHTVQYRIVAGKKKGQQQQRGQQQQQQHASDLPTDPEIEEFFNQLYREKFSQHFPPPSTSSPPTSPSHSAAAPPCNPHGGDSGAAGPRRRGDKVNRRQRRQ